MPKNKASENRSRSNDTARSSAIGILVLAILFFLLGLWMLAKATGFNLFDWLRSPSTYHATGINTRTGSAQFGMTGSNGSSGTDGTSGTNGGTGNGTDNSGTSNDLNLNAKTTNGVDINAGIHQGQIYVSPGLNPNPQGGVGGQATVNNQKVLDTGSVLK